MRVAAFAVMLLAIVAGSSAHAADAAFTQFIASLWPEAQAAGVSRATFDAETRGLEPDYKLPDLILPGRPATGAIVCACFGVGRNAICDAIAGGARTPAAIGAKLKAGTNCGSCVPELKQLIAESGGEAEPRRLEAVN